MSDAPKVLDGLAPDARAFNPSHSAIALAPHQITDSAHGMAYVTQVGNAEAVTLFGTTVTFLVESQRTGNAWSLLAYDAPPGFVAAAPHTHARTTETFFVLEGTLTVRLEQAEVEVDAFGCVVVPPRTRHTFRNAGHETVRFLALASPGGHDDFLRELLALIAAAPAWPPADPTPLIALAARYDTAYDAPS